MIKLQVLDLNSVSFYDTNFDNGEKSIEHGYNLFDFSSKFDMKNTVILCHKF